MSYVSLNKQVKDLLARTTQLESSAGAQQLTNSLLQFNMMGVVYTIPACLATIPFFNGIPIGFQLMQLLVGASIGKIYSQIMMELASLLDVESMMSGLADEAVGAAENAAENLINSQISHVNSLINQYTSQFDSLVSEISGITNDILDINNQISDLQDSLIGETDEAIIASINSQIDGLNSEISTLTDLKDTKQGEADGLSNYILSNLKNNILTSLESKLKNSMGLDITSIFTSQAKAAKQYSNSLEILAPWKET